MRIFLAGAFLLVVSSNGFSQVMQQATQGAMRPAYVTMESLRDRYRPLLVFVPSGSSREMAEQLRLLTLHPEELRERQVLVVPVCGVSGDCAGAANALSTGVVYLAFAEASAVRKRFHVGEGEFIVVLVGKDGGEKFRAQAPVTIEKLKALIDAMPMRQQEERNGHAK